MLEINSPLTQHLKNAKEFLDKRNSSPFSLIVTQRKDNNQDAIQLNFAPGKINVIGSDPKLANIKHAIINEPLNEQKNKTPAATSSSSIEFTYGTNTNIRSLINIVDGEHLVSRLTISQTISQAGVPESLKSTFLKELGIKEDINLLIEKLSQQDRQHLALGDSFFSPSNILVYCRPFEGLDSIWIERLASLISEVIEQNNNIAIVLDIDSLPVVWRTSDLVVIHGYDRQLILEKRNVSEGFRRHTGNVTKLTRLAHLINSLPEDEVKALREKLGLDTTSSKNKT